MLSKGKGSANRSRRSADDISSLRSAPKYLYDPGMALRSRIMPAATCAALLTLVVLSVQASQSAQAFQADSRFPEGPGKEALFKVCSGCHGPESAVAQFKTRDEWSK